MGVYFLTYFSFTSGHSKGEVFCGSFVFTTMRVASCVSNISPFSQKSCSKTTLPCYIRKANYRSTKAVAELF